MNINKIQRLKSKHVSSSIRKVIHSRKVPNSVSLPNETFKKGGGSCIAFYKPDLLKMAKMSLEECKKYREYLISLGRFYETSSEEIVDTFPKWIQEVIKK